MAMNAMVSRKRTLVTLLFAIPMAVLLLVGCATTSSSKSISLVKHRSYCTTDPFDARLYVHFTLRNTGASKGSIDIRPWRRYSDGSVNDSPMDTMTVDVPGGETKSSYGAFNYNPQEHELLECGVYVGDSTTVTLLRVES
jgi:hypothetical protein